MGVRAEIRNAASRNLDVRGKASAWLLALGSRDLARARRAPIVQEFRTQLASGGSFPTRLAVL